MTGAELLIYGKFLLTFGVLLGLPAWELLRLARDPGPRTPWPRGPAGEDADLDRKAAAHRGEEAESR